MTLNRAILLGIAGALVSGTYAHAATFATGYTIGSNLLGSTIVDGATHAGLATTDLRANDSANGAGAYAWVVAWDSLWTVGDGVSITGMAIPVRSPGAAGDTSNNTDNGTFTFTFYELNGGANANAWDGTSNGETVLTTATAMFVSAGSGPAIVPYVTFDSPINFTAASTGIAIHVDSTSSIRTRNDSSADGVDGIQANRASGSAGAAGHQWTVAGTITPIPEPSAAVLAGLAGLAVLRRRR